MQLTITQKFDGPKISGLGKKGMFMVMMLLVSIFHKPLSAQVSSYVFSQSVQTYVPLNPLTSDAWGDQYINGRTMIVDPASPLGSNTVTTGPGIPIGFNFYYDNQLVDRISICGGGWIALGNSNLIPLIGHAVNMTGTNTAPGAVLNTGTVFTPTTLRNRIAGFASSGCSPSNSNSCLTTWTAGAILSSTIGTAPNRIFVVQYNNMNLEFPPLSNLVPTADINFQIRLYEDGYKVEVRYGLVDLSDLGSAQVTSSNIQVGLGGSVSSDFNNRTSSSNWNATTAGGANTSTITANTSVVAPTNGLSFMWYPTVPCNGFVTPGITQGPDSICYGNPISLSLTGNTIATGVTYQWQRSIAFSPYNWTNIAGATAVSAIIPGAPPTSSQSQTTAYRLRMICTSSNDTSYSAPKTVYQKDYLSCYCTTSSAGVPDANEEIFNVTLGSLNNSSNCNTSNGAYTDYRNVVTPPNLARNNSYNLNLTLTSCTPSLAARVARVYIDYNKNGLFGDVASEQIFNSNYSASTPDPVMVNTSTTIPATASLGLTGMRVIYARGSITDACSSYGSGETEDYYVNIVDLPKPTITAADTIICAYTSLTINATNVPAGATVNWKRPNGQSYVGNNLVINGAQFSDSGVYKVWSTLGNLISDTAYFTLHIKPKPFPPMVPAGGSDVCQYDPTPNLGVVGQNVLWYTTQVGGFGNPVQPTFPTNVPNIFAYYVTQTIDGCESDRTLVLVKINPKPAPPKVISPQIYCQYDAVKPLPVTGQNLMWYTVSSGGLGSVVAPVVNTGYIDTLTFYVSQTINGCESDRIKFEIMIIEKPTGTILTARDWTCQYDTLNFTYYGSAPDGIANFYWAAPGGDIESGLNTRGPLNVRYNEPGTYTVTLLTTVGGCASGEMTKTINVRPAPTGQIFAKDKACVDERIDVVLNDVTPGTETFVWDFDGGNIHFGSEGGPYGISWGSPGNKVIKLTTYKNQCPSKPITDTVQVVNNPNAEILNAPSGKICAGNVYRFEARQGTNYGYLWTPTEMFTTNNAPSVYSNMQKKGHIYLEVYSPEGCRSVDSAMLDIENCCDVFVPDAFSPNGDGRNDIFRIRTEGLQTISVFRVVNRFGQTMFETTDPTQGWDGNFSGKSQDIGTYYYYLRYKCLSGETFEKKGDVTLIR